MEPRDKGLLRAWMDSSDASSEALLWQPPSPHFWAAHSTEARKSRPAVGAMSSHASQGSALT